MTEAELRQLLKENGRWSIEHKINKGYKYYYAVRRISKSKGGGRQEVYLLPAVKLSEKTEADILARLPVPK